MAFDSAPPSHALYPGRIPTYPLPADALDEEAAALLWRRYRAQVEIEPPSFRTGNHWQLTAQGWAGFIPIDAQLSPWSSSPKSPWPISLP